MRGGWVVAVVTETPVEPVTCPVCRVVLAEGDEVVVTPGDAGSIRHRKCWDGEQV